MYYFDDEKVSIYKIYSWNDTTGFINCFIEIALF